MKWLLILGVHGFSETVLFNIYLLHGPCSAYLFLAGEDGREGELGSEIGS